MASTKSRWSEYYRTEKYRGFRKVQEKKDASSAKKFMIFSNSKHVVQAWGRFNEEILEKIFDQIDQYHEFKLATDPVKRISIPADLNGPFVIHSVRKPDKQQV